MGNKQGVESSGKDAGEIISSPFHSLPEECISKIISFTTPRDAGVAATVSKTFESAVKSDLVWDKFIQILLIKSNLVTVPPSRVFSSKKELYFALREVPILSDDGTKSFWLEKGSRKKCVMLSAMDISIIWGDDPQYWEWITIPESKFETVAKLRSVCWFQIRGRTNTRVLSRRTRYSAYIVFKKVDGCWGFEDMPVEARVGVVGGVASKRFICFDPTAGAEGHARRRRNRNIVRPAEREDGWMEIELGVFFNGGVMNSDEIEMSALGTEQHSWKRGLIIQGIEIRPAKVQ